MKTIMVRLRCAKTVGRGCHSVAVSNSVLLGATVGYCVRGYTTPFRTTFDPNRNILHPPTIPNRERHRVGHITLTLYLYQHWIRCRQTRINKKYGIARLAFSLNIIRYKSNRQMAKVPFTAKTLKKLLLKTSALSSLF